MNYFLLMTAFLSAWTITYCQQIKPKFRILAPQVICNNKNSTVERPPQITISMQTEGGQRLTYRVQMYFEVLGGYQGQQHALSLWRAVRTMEKKINVKDKGLISDKNQINVNNTELIQGVFYTFRIIGIDGNGTESEAQNFTVTYSDGKIKRISGDGSIIPDDIIFLMLGSEMAYTDLEYKIEANVIFCNPRYDYYFKWELPNLPQRYQNLIQIPGNTLRIPDGILNGGETYSITAKLLQSNDSRILLTNTIDVKFKERGLSATLIPENVIIGISRPMIFKLYVGSDSSALKPSITWICKKLTENSDCAEIEEISEYQQSVVLYEKGFYTVTANVQRGSSVTVTSSVSCDPDVIVMPLFKNPPTKAIQSEEQFEMETTLDGLIPNCFAYWSVLQESGYQFFDSALIPGGLGNLSVTDLEGNFLSDLVDFANSTISRDILLVVPKKGIFPNWEGLKGNVKYKFRLVMTCPAPISNTQNQTETQIRRNVTSFSDITVLTNEPPHGQALEVTPQSGVGLKTIFKFSTGLALDEEIDYPLKYNFQIEFDGIKITIGEYYENMVTTSQLPFSASNISTMFEVCDSREACSQVEGPMIRTTMPLDRDIDFDSTISNIKASILRMEYDQAFGLALVAGITFKNMNASSCFEIFKNNFTKIIRSEINRLLENPTVPYYAAPSEIVKFINYTQKSFPIINADDGISQSLLELLESIENMNETGQIQSDLRRKRSISKNNYRMDVIEQINEYLDIIEPLLASKNESMSIDGMRRLVEKVPTFIKWLCRDVSFTSIILDKSIIKMEVRRTTIKQILRTNLTIPLTSYERAAYVQSNGNLNVNPKNDFCVGKIMFPSDYLSGQRNTDEIYELLIAESNGVENVNVVDISDDSGEANIFLTVPIKKEFGDFECQIWENKAWSSNICSTSSTKDNYVHCKCHKVGIFRAIESLYPKMESTAAIPFTEVTTAAALQTTEIILNNTEISTKMDVESTTNLLKNTTDIITTTASTLTDLSTQIGLNYSDALPSMISNLTSENTDSPKILNVTTSELEIITLQPSTSSSTLLSTTSTTSAPATVTELTKIIQDATLPTTITNNQSESVLSTVFSSVDSNTSALTLNDNEKRYYSSTTGYTLAIIFVLALIFIVIALYIYNRRKKPNTLVQQLEIISSEARTSNNAVKYARFHDEETMRDLIQIY